MRKAEVLMHGCATGVLTEGKPSGPYRFEYRAGYAGPPVSLNLPVRAEPYLFSDFPPFFDGLLPEGLMLDALLRQAKIDRNDRFSQLLAVGHDMVGAVTVREVQDA